MENIRSTDSKTHGVGEYYSQTLYQKGAKGETRIWRICVTGTPGRTDSGGIGIIHREHGILGGKMNQTFREIKEGKNIGKKNETQPIEQAISEAKSIVTKKQREGYSPDESKKGETDAGVILPMLAHDYHKSNTGLLFPCCAQPKLDGVRMIVERLSSGELRMTTRTGKPVYFMDHIRDALSPDILPVGIILDGELFTHDKTFEEITGIVRKSVRKHHNPEDAKVVKYHVFDAFRRNMETIAFRERSGLVHEIVSRVIVPDVIVEVPTITINTQLEADEIHERFVGEGHEGTMYRTPNSSYKIRLRSKDLLKRKDFITEEYRIVDAVEADGRDKGSVIWVVEITPPSSGAGDTSESPPRFNVRPRGSMEKRSEWWENRSEYIGKLLTVRFQNLTEFGIPRFPVGLTIRDYE